MVKATLTARTGGGGTITFLFNPGKVQLDKQVKTSSRGIQANSYEEALRATGNLNITLGDVKIVGPGTKATIDRLFLWTQPLADAASVGAGASGAPKLPSAGSVSPGGGSVMSGGGMGGGGLGGAVSSPVLTKAPNGSGGSGGSGGGMGGGGKAGGRTGGKASGGASYNMPVLLLSWGSGLSYQVMLQKITVNYDRFTAAGLPVLATVSLTLTEFTENLPDTNPTSGGLPDRGRHTVTSGDSIVRIANDVYRNPGAWRALAEANGLDDPLRLRPGRRLYLPSPGELEEAMVR